MTDPGGTLPRDFRDLLSELTAAGAEFVVVGGHAVARHGYVRTTLDLDVLVRPSPENSRRVHRALSLFGAPLAAHGVAESDFARPGAVYQIGIPPTRIDVITSIDGVDFESAWASRLDADFDGVQAPVIGREALIRNKRATGREKDRRDADELERG